MTPDEAHNAPNEIESLKAELMALARFWRSDWSEFDGRTLEFQIEDILKQYDSGKVGNYYRNKLKEQEAKL